MTKVHRRAEDLRSFASFLASQCERIKHQQSATQQSFERLGSVWNDAERRRFEPVYERSMQSLNRFYERAEQYRSYLRRMAQAVDDVYGS